MINEKSVAEVIERLGSIVWGPWTAALVLLSGLWIGCSCGGLRLARPREWWGATIGSLRAQKADGDGISPFGTATAALAGTLGTGNIVGVAAALTAGGAGAIFWMWIAGVAGMMTAYAENVLGIVYRRRDKRGVWLGGPMLYMSDALGARRLAYIWAALCAVSAFGVGNLTQVNSIAQSAGKSWGAPGWAVGAAVMLLAAPAVLGGVSAVSSLTERLVPFMALAYMLACAAVLAMNITRVPWALAKICAEAFKPSALGGGALGAALVGIRRGVFTNEAGMGSTVLIHSAAKVDHPARQGLWGMFEVFADTIVMCTVTALVIMTSGAMERTGEDGLPLEGVELSAAAFDQIFGRFSGGFIAVAMLLFAFATVVGWSCCGERAFSYITGGRYTMLYRLAYVLMALPGAVVPMRTVWALADLMNGLMTIPNTAAVVLLWRIVRIQSEDWRKNAASRS